MKTIEHKMITVNGINMHIAEKGQGPLVLFLHGYPELWYSWRHQILYMAAHGYRAVAPDLRGYGDTTGAPTDDITKFNMLHLVADVVALLDAICPANEKKVFVVCQDWGASIAWHLCLYRPDKVKALVSLGAPFAPRNPDFSPVEIIKALYGEDHFIIRFQEPKGKEFGDSTAAPIMLPSWLSEEDIDYVANKFEQTGFTGAINYYRCYNMNWELTAAWSGAQVQVPTKLILGDEDPLYPLFKDYILSGQFKEDVPNSEDVVILIGVSHYINQESADEVNRHILEYIRKF